MLRSTCCCDSNVHVFSEYISYKNEIIFKEYEGTIIGKCSSCGLLRTFAPKKSHFNPKQSDASFYEDNIEMFSQLFTPTITGIQKYIPQGSVLDIGCSSGILLDLLRSRGYDTYGIEPNIDAFKKAEKKFGSRIYHGLLDSYPTAKKFDVVILSHVLEHVENPVKEIIAIKKILSRKGIILIGIPNTRNAIFSLRGKYWEYLRPNEHIWHFTDRYLIHLLEKQGLRTLEKWYVNDMRRDYSTVKRLYFSFLCFINNFMHTGETVTVICRKIS